MKLKITKLNSLPAPGADGKYEPDTIYLVKTSNGIVQTLYTAPDGSLVGKAMTPTDVLAVTTTAPAVNATSSMFWLNPETAILHAKHVSGGTWSWVTVTPDIPAFNPTDMLTVSTTAPILPSSKVFWFDPTPGAGLHIQITENGVTTWKETDFLDETTLQAKVAEAATHALNALSYAQAAETSAQLSATKATEAAAQVTLAGQQAIAATASAIRAETAASAAEALAANATASADIAANHANDAMTMKESTEIMAGNAASSALSAEAAKVAAETAKTQTQTLKSEVQTLIDGIQSPPPPDMTGYLSKAENLAGLTDTEIARQNLQLGRMAIRDSIIDQDVIDALGYRPADEVVIGDIKLMLETILGPVTTPGIGNGGGGMPV